MKTSLFVIAFSLLSLSFANAQSRDLSASEIAKQVVTNKLLHSAARTEIKIALKGEKGSLGKMECKKFAGTLACSIEVLIHDDVSTPEAEETVYGIEALIKNEKVISAQWRLIAG